MNSTNGPNAEGAPGEGDATAPDRAVERFAAAFKVTRLADLARIPEHLTEGRFDLIVRLGHQIHGTAATFGLEEIGAGGARLEAAAQVEDIDGIRAEAEVLRALMEAP